jgi:hypothetical protein
MSQSFDIASTLGASLVSAGDPSAPLRTPMVMSCTTWQNDGNPNHAPIRMMVNPHSVQFKQPKRITKRNTQGGTIYFHWSDLNGSNLDILEIAFKGRTGNILNKPPVASGPSGIAGAIGSGLAAAAAFLGGVGPSATPNTGAAKHFTWARLYELTRTPQLDPATGNRNVCQIYYTSPLFPLPISFYGFFNQALDFGETAEQPFLVEWSFNFVVQYTMPDLNTISSYLQQVLALSPAAQAAVSNQISNTLNQGQAFQSAVQGANFSSG